MWFCPFSFGYCVVCSSSTYGFWLPPFGIIKLFSLNNNRSLDFLTIHFWSCWCHSTTGGHILLLIKFTFSMLTFGKEVSWNIWLIQQYINSIIFGGNAQRTQNWYIDWEGFQHTFHNGGTHDFATSVSFKTVVAFVLFKPLHNFYSSYLMWL